MSPTSDDLVDSLRPCIAEPCTILADEGEVYYRPTDKQAIALEHEYAHHAFGLGSNDRAEDIAGCTQHVPR